MEKIIDEKKEENVHNTIFYNKKEMENANIEDELKSIIEAQLVSVKDEELEKIFWVVFWQLIEKLKEREFDKGEEAGIERVCDSPADYLENPRNEGYD